MDALFKKCRKIVEDRALGKYFYEIKNMFPKKINIKVNNYAIVEYIALFKNWSKLRFL